MDPSAFAILATSTMESARTARHVSVAMPTVSPVIMESATEGLAASPVLRDTIRCWESANLVTPSALAA